MSIGSLDAWGWGFLTALIIATLAGLHDQQSALDRLPLNLRGGIDGGRTAIFYLAPIVGAQKHVRRLWWWMIIWIWSLIWLVLSQRLHNPVVLGIALVAAFIAIIWTACIGRLAPIRRRK